MTNPTALRIDLPADEQGLPEGQVKRLDKLLAKLARKDLTPRQRKAAAEELQAMERAIDARSDKSWIGRTSAETADLARRRGEEVQQSKSGAVRVNSRDALLAMVRKGHLTAEQYDTACDLRDAFERRAEALGSQLGAINGAGGGHNNDQFVLAGLRRAKAGWKIEGARKATLVGGFYNSKGQRIEVERWKEFAKQKLRPEKAWELILAICNDGKSLSSQGGGRSFEVNLRTFQLALEVTSEALRSTK